MDFKLVLSKLLTAFQEQNISYALIGGFAMGLWGGTRSTVDLDFLVNRDDMEKVDGIVRGLGYESRYGSENVSQYIAPSAVLGEIDFLHAFRETSIEMLQRSEAKSILGGKLIIKVLLPEDLIGLKLQAIRNNPKRLEVDMADIKIMLRLRGDRTDWPLIERYCGLLDMQAVFEELRRSVGL